MKIRHHAALRREIRRISALMRFERNQIIRHERLQKTHVIAAGKAQTAAIGPPSEACAGNDNAILMGDVRHRVRSSS